MHEDKKRRQAETRTNGDCGRLEETGGVSHRLARCSSGQQMRLVTSEYNQVPPVDFFQDSWAPLLEVNGGDHFRLQGERIVQMHVLCFNVHRISSDDVRAVLIENCWHRSVVDLDANNELAVYQSAAQQLHIVIDER